MARMLRIQRPGGRYHVTARGNDRQDIFRDEGGHFHCLELLNESARAASPVGVGAAPSPELVEERLQRLREFRWSSYLGYAGYQRPLAWVWREPLAGLCGGRNAEERCAALRSYTEGAVRQGGAEPSWARVVEGIALAAPPLRGGFAPRLGAIGGSRNRCGPNRRWRPGRISSVPWSGPRAKLGRISGIGIAIGDATWPCGWVGEPGG